MKSVSTGDYHKRLLDIYPLVGESLPTDDRIRDFFSKFGPILELYRYERTPSQEHKPEHVYIVFEADEAASKAKQHIRSLDATSCWKKSCTVTTGITRCPPELMRRIWANPSAIPSSPDDPTDVRQTKTESSSAEERGPKSPPVGLSTHQAIRTGANTEPLGKRSREESPDQDAPNKKGGFASGIEGSDITLDKRPEPVHNPAPQNASETVPSYNKEGHHRAQNALGERLVQTPRSRPSALELAEKAVELAQSKEKRTQAMEEGASVWTRLEQLQAERNEAIIQRDAAIVSCRAVERELRQLKKSSKNDKERTEKVLRLVTASLQSLQGESEESDA